MASDLGPLVSNLIGASSATLSPPHLVRTSHRLDRQPERLERFQAHPIDRHPPQANDAASLLRTDFPPRPRPTASRSCTTATVDLTSPSPPPPLKRRTPPTHADCDRPWKIPRGGPERSTLVSEIKNCNQIPLNLSDPGPFTDHLIETILRMQPKKPGYNSSLRPFNTIDDVVRPLHRFEDRGFNNGLGASGPYGQRPHANTPWIPNPATHRTYTSTAQQDSYSRKRRKTEHSSPLPSSPFDREAMASDPDIQVVGVVQVAPPSSSTRRSTPSQRAAPSSSRHDTGSRFSITGNSADFPRSELEATAILDSRHRKRQYLASQHTPTRHAAAPADKGTARSSPIILDDESPVSISKTLRQPQFRHFQQGIDAAIDDFTVDTSTIQVSKHFPMKSAKPGQSTLPSCEESRHQPSRPVSASDTLRNHFKRSQLGEEVSDDDLAISRPETFTRKRSYSSSKPAPLSRTSKAFKQSPTRAPQWPLIYVATHDLHQKGPDLTLKVDQSSECCIWVHGPEKKDSLQVAIRHKIAMSKINHADTDCQYRIRMNGPRNADDTQYQIDLQFEEVKHLEDFLKIVKANITTRCVITRDQQYMKKIFSKPFPSKRQTPLFAKTEAKNDAKVASPNSTNRPRLWDRMRNLEQNDKKDEHAEKSRDSRTGSVPTQVVRASGHSRRSTRASELIYLDADEAMPEELNVFKYSIEKGLGMPWARPLTYGSGRHGVGVNFDDLERLDEGEFLNDQLIDFYLLYLSNQLNVPKNKVYIFNTYFYSSLTRKVAGQKTSINYNAVARWTSKVDLFSYDYIVVPINQELHWYLAIICNLPKIARKPLLQGSEQSSQSDEMATHLQPDPETALLSTESPLAAEQEDEIMIFNEEDSNLNLVDADSTKLSSDQKDVGGKKSDDDSSITREVYAGELRQQADQPAKGILPFGWSRVSPKKSKRKVGPPAKKWDPEEPTIVILDSLGGGARSSVVRALKDYISQEAIEKRGMEANLTQNAFYAKRTQIPMQNNFSDCGVYLLSYAQKFFENPKEFIHQLLKGEMNALADWPDMGTSRIRDTMRDILFQLYEEQEEARKKLKAEKKRKKNMNTHAVEPQTASDGENKGTTSREKDNDGNHRGATMRKVDEGESDTMVPESPLSRRASPVR